ncbi:flagellar protein FlaG [Selenomonas ruminantium]|uniref:Flagellar protein FlaG n=1 Tax=Selenomonas ruminantium TaxID=971 RepID=A0A1K1N8K5_SELRU|nr:flagellar protein FlaG [Selenomonas ruminantium]SEA22893.1 flagellar protein FlaG [Selenomonas ruminantium]SFW31794.1 flagellar protein FlaG [Selenomonas ruminantium]
MVGKIQDIVSASIVAGAAERVSSVDTTSPSLTLDKQEPQVKRVDDAKDTSKYDPAEDKEKDKEREERDPMDEKTVSFMTQELNELMSKINCNLEFQYHKEVNMMSVKMLDKKTHEVLKEVPPEEMLEQMAKAREWLGAFLDKNA